MSDLSCIAFILFAKVNHLLKYARKNYATLEINPYSIRFFVLFVCFQQLRYFSFLKYILGIILFNAIS